MAARIAFVWDNFGPLHWDRVRAIKANVAADTVLGVELVSKSGTYDWVVEGTDDVEVVTLCKTNYRKGQVLVSLLRLALRRRLTHVFVCHYERVEVLLFALACRVLGIRPYIMNDSKFDDYPRSLLKELGKSLFVSPYVGGLSGSPRTADYMRFLGVPERSIRPCYDAVSVARLEDATPGPGHADRDFLIVARLVPKKNIETAIRAFALFVEKTEASRNLVICGSGPLLEALRTLSIQLGVGERVVFKGFLQTGEIAGLMRDALALLLPSVEEQFGQVIAEAQALRLPVIVSERCGARDELVRTGVNGFIVEPDNIEGLAFFMDLVHGDGKLWERLRENTGKFRNIADVKRFAGSVSDLISS